MVRRATAGSSPLDPDWLLQRHLGRDVASALATHARGRLADVGCGLRPYQACVPAGVSYLGVDVSAGGSRPDVCAVAAMLPFADASFDTVLCTQVLEHVPDPAAVLHEIGRVLRPGGRLILTAPQTWFLHEEPNDFMRFTRFGLESLCRRAGLIPIELRAQGGFWAVVGIFLSVHLGSYARWLAERRRGRAPLQHGRSPAWRRLLWPLRWPMAAANLVFAALDAIPHPRIIAVNHLVVAERAGGGGSR
jgi:SAM-dependent methyltransferase